MTPFRALTPRGRVERLRRVAIERVLPQYGLEPRRVSAVGRHSFNTFFRIDTSDGERFALRVGDEHRIHAPMVEEVEAVWLDAIDFELELGGPRLIPAGRRRHTVELASTNVDGVRTCSLMTWVRGAPMRDSCDAVGMFGAGRLLALLHEHAATFRCPIAMPFPIRSTRAVYFGDPRALRVHDSRWGSLIRDAMDRAQQSIDELWSSPPSMTHLLHGDLGPHNVMRWRNHLAPIDFQDLQFGFDVQDIGITIADLRRNAPQWIEPFAEGYRSVRRWPDLPPDLLDAFAGARSLNMMSLGLLLRRGTFLEFFDRHAQLVADWMAMRRSGA